MDKIKAKVENVLHKDHSTTGSTTHTTGGTAEGEYGQHNSRVANAADPRIDSDLDGSRNAGLSQGTGNSALGSLGSGGVNTQHNTTGLSGHNNAYDGTHAGNHLGGTGTGTGGLSNSTNAGPHDSNLANKIDPRVDSDLDGRGNRHGASTGAAGGVFGASGSHATRGSGTAQNTDGPHNSDLVNKLDPRVDSDRDGSTTIGGNATRS